MEPGRSEQNIERPNGVHSVCLLVARDDRVG